MTWSLEIHHLYFNSSGDATIIIARHPAVGANPAVRRTVLIDGGRSGTANVIHQYLTATLNINSIDVIAVTHYDEDHFYGIVKLITRAAGNITNNAIIYDTGRLPPERLWRGRENQHGQRVRVASEYQKYVNHIGATATIRRATATVNSFHIAHYDANDLPVLPTAANTPAVAPYLSPDWLIDKDIMWGNGMSGVGAAAWAENPPAYAPNPPRLVCVTANKYVRQAPPPPAPAPVPRVRFISNLNIYNGPNRMPPAHIADYDNIDENGKSLGFLLTFNQFRYFVGGDLERMHEDGANTVHGGGVFHPGVRQYLNANNSLANRVLAMKTSHHGAETASSRVFLTALRPAAAIISCGRKNKFNHPRPGTINSLDGYPEVPVLASDIPFNKHPPRPPIPPLRPIKHYLTGFQVHTPPVSSLAGDSGQTAGPAGHHVKITVSHDQSNRPRTGQVYRGLQAIIPQVAGAGALVLTAAQINTIAELAVQKGTIYALAEALGSTAAIADAALNGAAYAGNKFDNNAAPVNGLLAVALAASINVAAVAAAGSPVQAAIDAARGFDGGRRAGYIAIDVPISANTHGVAAALGAALMGNTAAQITLAAGNAGAQAPVAQAAGFAAARVFGVYGALAAGFAAAAACSAARANATVPVATTLGAAIGAMAGNATAANLATLVTQSAHDGGLAWPQAALVGAIAAASHHDGDPAAVQAATTAALMAAALGAALPLAATNAQNAATIAGGNNSLFNVVFQSGANHLDLPHAG